MKLGTSQNFVLNFRLDFAKVLLRYIKNAFNFEDRKTAFEIHVLKKCRKSVMGT